MMAAHYSSGIKKTMRSAMAIALAMLFLDAINDAQASSVIGSSISKDWETQWASGKSGFTYDLSYDYINENQLWYGNSAASDAFVKSRYASTQEIEAYTKSQTVSATLIYTHDTWCVSAVVPYVTRDHGTYGSGPFNFPTLGSSFSSVTDSGIGDIKVTGRFSGLSAGKKWGLIAGVKLPTGNTSTYYKSGANPNTPMDPGLQIGSGSTDIIYGAYATGTLDNYGWFLQGTVQHAIATKPASGNLDYRPGDSYALNTGLRYTGLGDKVTPMLQLNIITRDSDTGSNSGLNGPFISAIAIDPITGAADSGGTLAYLSPGISGRVAADLTAYGFVQIPVYQNVSSLQLTSGYILSVGLSNTF